MRYALGAGAGTALPFSVYAAVIRKRKAAAYARRKRKRERLEKR